MLSGTAQELLNAVPPNFWLDVMKTFIGAFLGAGLAFASSLIIQWRMRRRENIKAGNLALSLLVTQLNDFSAVKKSFLQMRDEALKKNANTPVWLQLRPSLYLFTESHSFDVANLSFLFDKHGATTVQKLLVAEHRYRSLVALVKEHRAVRELIQDRSAELGLRAGDKLVMSELEDKIGPHLIGRAVSASEALLRCFSEDSEAYLDAWSGLRTELVRRYGKKFIDMKPAGKIVESTSGPSAAT